MTPDELYIYTERLAILCADGVPTEAMIELAKGDVRRFRSEQNYDTKNNNPPAERRA